METTCQASYPLNSENASPPGTFKVYLSWAAWADRALPPKALTSAVTIAIVRMRLLFITNSSFVKLGGLDGFPAGVWHWIERRARPPHGSEPSPPPRPPSLRRTKRGPPPRLAVTGSGPEPPGAARHQHTT